MESIRRVAKLDQLEAPQDAVFVVDERFAEHHGWDVPNTLLVRGGEGLKTLEAVGALASRVLEIRSTRPMTLVAVGGGSVGDAVGFLASVLWRGVKLWHVPTTLLAAVDSAHGGKTAVNLATRKNQLGTFWPAEVVVLAEDVLAALPVRLRAEGIAELVKGLWLGAPGELATLDTVGVDALAYGAWAEVGGALLKLLDAAIAVKQSIVARDPREELGIRTVLNLGHTLAHALELEEGFAHGRAVAWGMAAAGAVSRDRGHLSASDCASLWGHVFPLLGARLPSLSLEQVTAALRADKKRVDARLRSVLLRGPGDVFVVDDVSDQEWFEALGRVRALADGPVDVRFEQGRGARLEIEASKSIMNRLLAIAALRPGSTTVSGTSHADDVRAMRAALDALAAGRDAEVGEGGTTYRFALATAAAGTKRATLVRGPRLSQRPHAPLHDALRAAGAHIEEHGARVAVSPLPPGDLQLKVDASESSQFASALALVSATGRRVTLELTGDVASRPYLDITLTLLARAGVAVQWVDENALRLQPTDSLHVELTLEAEPDASSAAVWAVAKRLGVAVETNGAPTGLQPDAAVEDYLWSDDETDVLRDLKRAPDLAPVLCAAAALTPPRVRLTGASHLRLKESNRIEDLVDAFAAVGLHVVAHSDGLEIPEGVQTPRAESVFPTHGDHRLAMAACLLAVAAPVRVQNPAVVAKSYPEFWRDAMTAGFRVRPVF